MRITLDWDTHNPLKIAFYLAKGIAINRKFPSIIRKTKRGYHCVFRDMDITEKEMFLRRYKLGDDIKRIHLDMTCPKKPKQVLFSKKDVYVYEYDFVGNIIGKRKVQ
jgi:hypothetical protein